MRYGRIIISVDYLEELLTLHNGEDLKGRRCVTDLPDDTHIESVHYSPEKRCVEILVAGSGAPLKKCAEGSEVPVIALVFEAIDK